MILRVSSAPVEFAFCTKISMKALVDHTYPPGFFTSSALSGLVFGGRYGVGFCRLDGVFLRCMPLCFGGAAFFGRFVSFRGFCEGRYVGYG